MRHPIRSLSRRNRILSALLVIVGFSCAERLGAEDRPKRRLSPSEPLQTLWARKFSNALIVPAEVSGKHVGALVDTGAICTTYDVSLRPLLKGAPEKVRFQTPVGVATMERFVGRELKIDDIRCDDPNASVACADLGFLGSIAKRKVDLILGMDVLANLVVRIEAIGPRVTLAKRLTERKAEPEFVRFEDGLPSIEVPAEGLPKSVRADALWFKIDTAFFSPTEGALERVVFKELEKNHALTQIAQGKGEGLGGEVPQRQGRFSGSLTLAGRRHAAPVFCEADYSVLGPAFLYRYSAVTFDFPNKKAYFEGPPRDKRTEPPFKAEGVHDAGHLRPSGGPREASPWREPRAHRGAPKR